MQRNESDVTFFEECFKEFGNFLLVTIRTNEENVGEGLEKLGRKSAADYAKALAFLNLVEEATPYLKGLLTDLIKIDPQGEMLLGLLERIKDRFKIERVIKGE